MFTATISNMVAILRVLSAAQRASHISELREQKQR